MPSGTPGVSTQHWICTQASLIEYEHVSLHVTSCIDPAHHRVAIEVPRVIAYPRHAVVARDDRSPGACLAR
jgi:hypothetical protein